MVIIKKKGCIARLTMDGDGNPIKAKTVSKGYKGSRKNIVQMPENMNHEPTPVFVNSYLTRQQMQVQAKKNTKPRG